MLASIKGKQINPLVKKKQSRKLFLPVSSYHQKLQHIRKKILGNKTEMTSFAIHPFFGLQYIFIVVYYVTFPLVFLLFISFCSEKPYITEYSRNITASPGLPGLPLAPFWPFSPTAPTGPGGPLNPGAPNGP